MSAIRIALVDDQQLFRNGIASLIAHTPGLELTLEADNGLHCLQQLETIAELPHIALVDMEMPVMDGMELNARLHAQYPDIRVIILSVHARERLIARMIQAGASGYLFKNCNKEELLTAIQTTYSSGFYINAQVLKAMQSASAREATVKNVNGIPIEISAREKEVLAMICRELTNAEIAAQLYVSVRTVEGHRNNLLNKTGCRNTAGLVLFAIKYHFFELPF